MIQLNKDQLQVITSDSITDLLSPILEYRKQMQKRYARKTTDTSTMAGGVESDGRLKAIIAFEYYIVQMAQGYLGGKSPQYIVEDKGYEQALEYIRQYNDDAAMFIELIHDYLITCGAYLYIYEDKYNEVRYARFDPLQTVAIYDYSTPPEMIATIRQWTEKNAKGDDVTMTEMLTVDSVKRWNGETSIEIEEEENLKIKYWNDVPCVAFENPDNIAIFEPVITIINTYEQILNNIKNYTHSNDVAKLLIKNYDSVNVPGTPEYQAEINNIVNQQVLFVGDNGGLEWLLKQSDYNGLLDVLKNLHQSITMLTGVPDMTDESFSSAASGVALGYKLYSLEQYAATIDRVFKKGYTRLIEIITNRINLKKGTKYDFRAVGIKFIRNIPTDKAIDMQNAITAFNADIISKETAIGISGLELDAMVELDKIAKEEEANYNKVIDRGVANELLDETRPRNEETPTMAE